MKELLHQPLPWYIAGALIGFAVPLLLLLGNKPFGVSSSLRHICAACLPAQLPFFQYDWKNESWNLLFVSGIVLGAWIASAYFENTAPVNLHPATAEAYQSMGIKDFSGLLPKDLFQWRQLFSLKGIAFFVVGGFLVGFGTRYAGGCTSGHSIFGLSTLQLPSLFATIAFMIGGFLSVHFLIPYLLQL